MPKISVIIPIYNVEKYLKECLDSVVNQTFKDIEIICVDDCGTDNSILIAEEYAKKDERIKIIHHETNKGPAISRNTGMDNASGEYICFLDSDDFIELDALEIIFNSIKDLHIDIVQFDFQRCTENSIFIKNEYFKNLVKKYENIELNDKDIINYANFKNKSLSAITMAATDKVYNLQFLRKNNIRFPLIKYSEDIPFSFIAVLSAKNIMYLNKNFYHYRVRAESLTQKESNNVFSGLDGFQKIKDFLIKKSLFADYFKSYIDYLTNWIINNFYLIPPESTLKYQNLAKDLLPKQNYKKFMKSTELKLSFLETIFSIRNRKINGGIQKQLCILGIRIPLYTKKTLNDNKLIKYIRQIYKFKQKLFLKNKDFSLIASNCNGMFMLKDLNLPYKSPFVNLWLYPKDFIKFLQNMDYYLGLNLSFIKQNEINYPIGVLDDIKLYFQHFKTEQEALEKWEKRKKRIDKNNLFVIMTERDGCTYEDLKDFDKLPIKNKKVFTKNKYLDIKSAVYISGYEECECLGLLFEYKSKYSIKRRYEKFDYVSWFNEGKKCLK